MAPILLFLVVAAGVSFLRSRGASIGYDQIWKPVLLALALLVPVGIVAALVVLIRTRARRATSLRTRSFFVIAGAIVIPALCLSAFGVWAYYRSWDTAAALYSGQAMYSLAQLQDEVSSLDHMVVGPVAKFGSNGAPVATPLRPARLSAARRAALSQAILSAYARSQREAWWGSLDSVESNRVLPVWAVNSLIKSGYAIGTWRGPSAPGRARFVAWRVGKNDIRYYNDTWPAVASFTAPTPFDRLLRIGLLGIALIAVLGVLGAWILSRSVVRPVRRLAEASGRLAEGEAGVTVTPEGPRELRDLADSFNEMNAKLTKAQETEQAFLLSVSHELKTPLTSIRGYAEGIGDGTVTPADGSAVIGVESARLERLVGDLLDSARMRKSAFAVRREAVDLTALAHDVARRYEGTAHDAGLTLLLNTEAGGGVVADNDRVLQVVSNLVENAIRCTPAPGTVTITTAPGAVSVADTGRGLTGDDLPRAFERFYLYSRYGTDRPVGTGLGLAIVKELTEAMGGTVSVASAVGVGTAFTVALPHEEASTLVVGPAADVTLPLAASASVVPALAFAPRGPPPRPSRPRMTPRSAEPPQTRRTMRRDRGRRRIYRSRALRRRRSAFVLCVLAALVGVVLAAGQSRGSERVTYDRSAAAAYADTWALRTNPAYWSSPDNDCADFVSQCLAAGGLRPLTGAGGDWHENGTDFPTVAWVNCTAQERALSAAGQGHTRYIAHITSSPPGDWAPGDVVYLGAVVDGKTEWQHVIICAGRDGGRWVYDSHTTAYLHRPLTTWYPAHFSRIRFCHIADSVSYGGRR